MFRLAALFSQGFGCIEQRYAATTPFCRGVFERIMAILQSSDGAHRPSRGPGFLPVVYLVAIAVATLGWLWLIVWIAMQLF